MNEDEQDLKEALVRRAATTTASPDAWGRISRRARRRRLPLRVLVPAMALPLVLVVASVLVFRRGDGGQSVTAGSPGVRAGYALGKVPVGYRLTKAGDLPGDRGRLRVRVYGRRRADGVSVSASIAVYPSKDPAAVQGTKEARADSDSREVTVGGHRAVLRNQENGLFHLQWLDAPDSAVAISAYGVSEREVMAAANSLRPPSTLRTLPRGFRQLYEGPAPLAGMVGEHQRQLVYTKGDQELFLAVVQGAGVDLDTVSWLFPRARVVRAQGRPGLLSEAATEIAASSSSSRGTGEVSRTLQWSPRPGVLLSLTSRELSEAQLLELADGVHEVNEDEAPARPQRGTVIAQGQANDEHWEARARRDGNDGVCLELEIGGVGSASCSGPASSDAVFAVQSVAGRVPFVRGILRPDVAAVRIELAKRPPIRSVPLRPAGFSVRFLMALLPEGGVPTTVVALDARGREIGRQPVLEEPPTGPPATVAPSTTTTVP